MSKEKIEHSLLPWKIMDAQIVDANGEPVAITHISNSEANERHIVRAVNCFEDLWDALQLYHNFVSSMRLSDSVKKLVTKAEAALAKCKEGE